MTTPARLPSIAVAERNAALCIKRTKGVSGD